MSMAPYKWSQLIEADARNKSFFVDMVARGAERTGHASGVAFSESELGMLIADPSILLPLPKNPTITQCDLCNMPADHFSPYRTDGALLHVCDECGGHLEAHDSEVREKERRESQRRNHRRWVLRQVGIVSGIAAVLMFCVLGLAHLGQSAIDRGYDDLIEQVDTFTVHRGDSITISGMTWVDTLRRDAQVLNSEDLNGEYNAIYDMMNTQVVIRAESVGEDSVAVQMNPIVVYGGK